MRHMKAVHQDAQTTKVSTSSTTPSDDNNEDSDLPLETPCSHIELGVSPPQIAQGAYRFK